MRRPLVCSMNGMVWTSCNVLWMLVSCRLSTRRRLERYGITERSELVLASEKRSKAWSTDNCDIQD
jgi:hypothetical protein